MRITFDFKNNFLCISIHSANLIQDKYFIPVLRTSLNDTTIFLRIMSLIGSSRKKKNMAYNVDCLGNIIVLQANRIHQI